MFCPNCGTANQESHKFCRSCGLKLDEISRNVAEQFPSKEYAALVRRRDRLEKFGLVSLGIMAIVGLSMLLYKVGAYKAELFGEATLMWSAFAAFAVFGLTSVFLFNYAKTIVNVEKLNPNLPAADEMKPADTKKLIEDRPFQPASVVEHTTELLRKK